MPDIGDELIALLPRLRRFARLLARSEHAADDLVQGACERALRFAHHYQEGTRFDAWVFTILRNLWLDNIRRTRRESSQAEIEPEVAIDDRPGIEARLTLASMRTAIEALPDDQREIVFLVCIEDLSYREAAEILDVPIGTVMSRLARARTRLKRAAGIGDEVARSSKSPGQTA